MASPAPSDDAVRAALNDLLGWREIARSGQLVKFLTYIVEAKLAGEEDAIKAYAIAVDVFGRPASFDPQADPIVRVQARRLRALLDQYYAQDPGKSSLVRIRLPVGRYVPEFELVTPEAPAPPAVIPPPPEAAPAPPPAAPAAEPAVSPQAGQVLAGIFFTVALVGLLAWWLTVMPRGRPDAAPAPDMPGIVIHEFRDLTGAAVPQPMVAGLALELVTDLSLFGDVHATYAESSDQPADAPPLSAGQFSLIGLARLNGANVDYSITIVGADPDAVLWRQTVSLPLVQASTSSAIDGISRRFALMLGSHRGPLHAPARRWAESEAGLDRPATPYLCRVLFEYYRDSGQPRDALEAQNCVLSLGETDRDLPWLIAINAALAADTVGRDPSNRRANPEILHGAQVLSRRALALDPLSSFIWEQAARIRELSGASGDARSAYLSALQLNPANADALAAFGRMQALGSHWQAGDEMAMTALTQSPDPPPWYYAGPALNALRRGDDNLAISYAESLAVTDRELGSVIAVVAALGNGNLDVVDRHLPELLAYPSLRAAGIMPRLRQRVTDPQVLALFEQGLVRAGVPREALDRAF